MTEPDVGDAEPRASLGACDPFDPAQGPRQHGQVRFVHCFLRGVRELASRHRPEGADATATGSASAGQRAAA